MPEQTKNEQQAEPVDEKEQEVYTTDSTEETGESGDEQPIWERSEAYDNR